MFNVGDKIVVLGPSHTARIAAITDLDDVDPKTADFSVASVRYEDGTEEDVSVNNIRRLI